MEAKTWTTPEELIEMVHWLSGAPGKRWVRDNGKTELTWGVGNAGMVGLVFGIDGECGPLHAWTDDAPYTFLRDESGIQTVEATIMLGNGDALGGGIEEVTEPKPEPWFVELKRLIHEDHTEPGSYAWSWLCNIAMSAYEEGVPHTKANRAAVRFMELLFEVDMRPACRKAFGEQWDKSEAEPESRPDKAEQDVAIERIARIVVRQELAKAEVVKDTDGKLRIAAGGA